MEIKKIKVEKDTIGQLLENLLKRSPSQYGSFQEVVDEVIEDVRTNGDDALIRLTQKFDQVSLTPETMKVTEEEIKAAYHELDENLIRVLKRSAERIRDFHQRQVRNTWMDTHENGVILGQRVMPIDDVGIYVPGGNAPLASSVLMNVIPAKVAGCKRIAMATPPGDQGKVPATILVAADIAGATEIYKVGGAQAIAALAYGTETIPKVNKVCGPGNIFVALAKKSVYGLVGIDSIAGPSEVMVLADETANPKYVAADLLSQAEHDPLASAILVTTEESLADQVAAYMNEFTEKLSRKEIIEQSISNYGYLLIAKDLDEAIEIANEIASEHLEIATAEPFQVMTKIKNAGAMFLGEYSCEPLGDYMAGPNHVLPTNGTAKFFSPLSVDDFIKKSSILSFSKEGMEELAQDVMTFANAESLTAHANSIAVRLEK